MIFRDYNVNTNANINASILSLYDFPLANWSATLLPQIGGSQPSAREWVADSDWISSMFDIQSGRGDVK